MTHRITLGAMGAVALVLGVSEAARAVSLDSLISSGGTLTVNGVTYSNFSSKGNLSAGNVDVQVTAQGLAFSGQWDSRRGKVAIGYSVAVDPTAGTSLSNASMTLTPPDPTGTRTAIKVKDQMQATIGKKKKNYNLQVNYDSSKKALSNHLSSTINFNPAVTSMKVVKNIDVSAGFGAFATLNFVDTSLALFSNAAAPLPAIPEPLSLALLPLGLAGLAIRRKLRA